MAITNTRAVQRIETYPADTAGGDPRLMVVYEHTFDDSTDDALPVTSTVVKHLSRYVVTTDEDGNETSTATDVTGEDQLVQDICGAIWTD
jgi:hypothetical protein